MAGEAGVGHSVRLYHALSGGELAGSDRVDDTDCEGPQWVTVGGSVPNGI